MNDFPDPWRDLGEFIREQRNVARLSVRRLSDMAGISNPYLSQIERGLRRPSAEILQQIARALRISAETLYVRAGILDAREVPGDLTEAILGEPTLSDEQKQTLLRIYLSFRRENDRRRGRAGLTAAGPRSSRPRSSQPSASQPSGRVGAPDAGGGGPVDAHLAPDPARHRRRRRDERLRPRARRRPGPLRGGLRGLHPGRQRGLPGHRQRRARPSGPPHSGRSARSGGQGAAPGAGAGLDGRGRGPPGHARQRRAGASTPSTPTTGCRAWPATPSNTSSTSRSS